MGKVTTLVVQIVLVVVVIILGYLLFNTLSEPVIFENNKAAKYEDVKDRLRDIVEAQEGYKSVKGYYASDFVSLIHTLRYDSVMNIRSIGSEGDTVRTMSMKVAIRMFEINPDLPQEQLLARVERAVARYNDQIAARSDTAAPSVRDAVVSYIVKDTFYVPALANVQLKEPLDSLPYIPHSNGAKFEMSANILEVGAGRVKVPTYEVVAYNKEILREEPKEFYKNMEGIRLGNLNQPSKDIIEFKLREEEE